MRHIFLKCIMVKLGNVSLLVLLASCLRDSHGFIMRQPHALGPKGLGASASDSILKAEEVTIVMDRHDSPLRTNHPPRDKQNLWKSIAISLGILSAIVFSPIAATNAYDGFADYAQENKMQQSDVSCFINQCGEQTKNLGKDIKSIRGIVCLGQCKGEQSCATRCFAEFGGPTLDDWLSCTIEENECVKVPKPDGNLKGAADGSYKKAALKAFNPNSLIGTWYKTDGLNPNYDLFDCQSNTFKKSSSADNELDMDIQLRISRPAGGFWENSLQEHMVLDPPSAERTMSTKGKMYGLTFEENWYIVGESAESDKTPFKLVAYQGRTLQGSYEGAFVYAKEPILPEEARPAVRAAAQNAGWDFDKDFTRIDNTCPANTAPGSAGTSSSSTGNLWQLVVGEGGIIDWISPGWRGEYDRN